MKTRVISDVISRRELLNNYRTYNYEDALIGFWSPGDWEKADEETLNSYKKAQSFFVANIRQDFWDTEDNVPGYDTISESQADELVRFIYNNQNRRFVIHCDAGQSRSAGAALAVECILKCNGDRYAFSLEAPFVGSNPRYTPNRKVYDKIMDAWDRFQKENYGQKDN